MKGLKLGCGQLARACSAAALLVLVWITLYGIVSVIYLRSLPGGLVPALFLGFLFYLAIKLIQLKELPGWTLNAPHWLMIGVVVLPGISLLGQLALNLTAVDVEGRDTSQFAFSFWIVGVLWFFVGAAVATAAVGQSNFLTYLILGFLLFGLWLGSDGVFVIHYGNLSRGADGVRFTHLHTSDYAVFSLALAYGLATKYARYLVAIVAAFVLFALGGRAALFSFMTALLLYQYFFGAQSSTSRVFGGVVLASGLLAVFIFLRAVDAFDLAGKDLLFSEGYTSDSSVAARLDFVKLALDDLLSQAAFGDPSLIVARFSTIGAYMHNLLSAWQFYGALFFLVILIALVQILMLSHHFRKSWHDSLSVTFGLLAIYVVISVVVGKSVAFYLLWLVLGFWLERWVLWSSIGTRRFLPVVN